MFCTVIKKYWILRWFCAGLIPGLSGSNYRLMPTACDLVFCIGLTIIIITAVDAAYIIYLLRERVPTVL